MTLYVLRLCKSIRTLPLHPPLPLPLTPIPLPLPLPLPLTPLSLPLPLPLPPTPSPTPTRNMKQQDPFRYLDADEDELLAELEALEQDDLTDQLTSTNVASAPG